MPESQSSLFGSASMLVGVVMLVLAILVDGLRFERVALYFFSGIFFVLGYVFPSEDS